MQLNLVKSLPTALCYLEAIHAKVPELVEREKTGDGVQGELDLSGKIVQGDVDADEWLALLLDSVMADFIHTDAAIDANAAETDAMATVKAVDSDEEPQSASSFTSQLTKKLCKEDLEGEELWTANELAIPVYKTEDGKYELLDIYELYNLISFRLEYAAVVNLHHSIDLRPNIHVAHAMDRSDEFPGDCHPCS
jgi:hypothetical protein